MIQGVKFSAVVTLDGKRWLAQCEEVDRAGEGATPEEAVASLRTALREYFGHAEAVAPPEEEAQEEIEIVVVDGPGG